ncbi:MAG: hypothetical protein M3331_07715 [Actinomycetota bacterium]|nr:hypothetical protein [Actinomycetota bacterium]
MRTPVASLAGILSGLPLRRSGLALLAVIALAVAGCGNEEEATPEAVEGEPLELDDELLYNVSITRFLNPNIVEDEAYLEGAPEEPQGMTYMGVFLQIKNENDEEEIPSAQNYAVIDGSHQVYRPVEDVETPFSLDVGAPVPPEGQIPALDTVASAGPTQGALLLFLVSDDVSEERPLELRVSSVIGGEGMIELDI